MNSLTLQQLVKVLMQDIQSGAFFQHGFQVRPERIHLTIPLALEKIRATAGSPQLDELILLVHQTVQDCLQFPPQPEADTVPLRARIHLELLTLAERASREPVDQQQLVRDFCQRILVLYLEAQAAQTPNAEAPDINRLTQEMEEALFPRVIQGLQEHSDLEVAVRIDQESLSRYPPQVIGQLYLEVKFN